MDGPIVRQRVGTARGATAPGAPLGDRPRDGFWLEGTIEGHTQWATCDGRVVVLTRRLLERAGLAVALDDARGADGDDAPRSTLHGDATHVGVTLARSCDVVTVFEYTWSDGHRLTFRHDLDDG